MRLAELPVPDGDAGRARDALDDVLARPEFQDDPEPLLQRATGWALERLGELLDAVFGGGGGGVLGWVIVTLLVGAAVMFAVRFTRGVQRDPGVAGATGVGVPRRTAADWRADAEAHEAAGAWRAALRCRWRALVADLAARGLVEEVPGRTAGEYRLEVAANAPRVAPDFDGATGLFEAAWYGDLPTGPEESARFRAHADRASR